MYTQLGTPFSTVYAEDSERLLYIRRRDIFGQLLEVEIFSKASRGQMTINITTIEENALKP